MLFQDGDQSQNSGLARENVEPVGTRLFRLYKFPPRSLVLNPIKIIFHLNIMEFFFFFFNCYLTVPWPTLGRSQMDSLTNPMLITVFVHIRPDSHRVPRNEVGSLSPAERLADFEPGTFRFLLQRLDPLGHSPLNCL